MSRSTDDGQWIVVPDNLAQWERDLRESTALDGDTRRLLLAMAHLARRAMVRDGDRFWVGADELASAANCLAVP